MNISTRQLTAFLHAARSKSFTRAAEQLHITQAGFSLMMRELEKQLGCRLFDRTTRSVELTDAGRCLLPVAERALEELTSAFSELDQLGLRSPKRIKVGVTPLLAATLMPHVHAAYRRMRPQITLRMVDLGLDELYRRVESGELDCALGTFPKNLPHLQRSLLFNFDLLHLDAPASKSVKQGFASSVPSIRWRDLKHAPLVQLPPDNPMQRLIAQELQKYGLKDHGSALTFNHIETIVAMVSAGAGAAIIPSVALAMCRGHQVQVRRLVDPAVKVGLYLIAKRGRSQPEILSEFTSLLLRTLSQVLGDVTHSDAAIQQEVPRK